MRVKLRALAPAVAKAGLDFGGVRIWPSAPGKETRAYRKLVKFARASGLDFDGETLRGHPELALGWPAPQGAAPCDPQARIAVVLHLHYGELWPEIAGLLARWRTPFALLVSLTRADVALTELILRDCPGADIEAVENRGRDVRPFLSLLETGRLDRFDLVCKIHGKRSLRDGASPLYGELFRRAAFLDLIGDPAEVEAICERFAREPKLGLIGPERFRAHSRHGDAAEVMGASRVAIEGFAARMGARVGADFDVFHGTMFWARPQALASLRGLKLAGEFAPEAGRSDGALEHAVEGLFNLSVRAAGYQVAGVAAA